MCEASLYPAAQFETLSYGCSLELPAFAAGTAQGPMWADIVRPDPRTMKLLAGEREREGEAERGEKVGDRVRDVDSVND